MSKSLEQGEPKKILIHIPEHKQITSTNATISTTSINGPSVASYRNGSQMIMSSNDSHHVNHNSKLVVESVGARKQTVQCAPIIYCIPVQFAKKSESKDEEVLCQNCGIVSHNLSVCSSCRKPITTCVRRLHQHISSDSKTALCKSSSSKMSVKEQPRSSLNTSRFYSNSNSAADFKRFVAASENQNCLKIKRKRSYIPDDKIFQAKPSDCITISDSSDESDSERTPASSNSNAKHTVHKSPSRFASRSNLSNNMSPVPCKKSKEGTSDNRKENDLLAGTSGQSATSRVTQPIKPICSINKPPLSSCNQWQHCTLSMALKSVRIGQYHSSKATDIRISELQMSMSSDPYIIRIEWFAVDKIEIFTNSSYPGMFLSINPNCIAALRNQLRMVPGKSPYFDPGGRDDQKHILFYIDSTWLKTSKSKLFEKLRCIRKKLNKSSTKSLIFAESIFSLQLAITSAPPEKPLSFYSFHKNFITELSTDDANLRQMQIAEAQSDASDTPAVSSTSSPKSCEQTVVVVTSIVTTLTSRNTSVTPKRNAIRLTRSRTGNVTSRPSSFSADESILLHPPFTGPRIELAIFPAPPAKGGICVTNEDQYCLNEGEFLNDVIIDFYLKYIMEKLVNEEDRRRSHVFSCFFYKRFTQTLQGKMKQQEDKLLKPAERRYARVKKWTRGVDIFSKDFIFIPINEASHWFLAVVCFPSQNGRGFVDPVTNAFTPISVSNATEPVQSENGIVSRRTAALISIEMYSDDEADSTPENANLTERSKPKTPEAENTSSAETCRQVQDGGTRTGSDLTQAAGHSVSPTQSDSPKSGDLGGKAATLDDLKLSVPAGAIKNKKDIPNDFLECASSSNGRQAALQETDIGVASNSKACQVEHREKNVDEEHLSDDVADNKLKCCKMAPGKDCHCISEKTKEDVRKSNNFQSRGQYREPCILIFDSLRGPGRSKTATHLRDYLGMEWRSRKLNECGEKTFDKTTMKMCSPIVPQQDNYSDCGVFLLQYVEQIFKNPIKNFMLPIKSLSDWFDPSECKQKRKDIYDIIQTLHDEQSKQKEENVLPT